MLEKKLLVGKGILVVIYLVGIIGLANPLWRQYFVVFTPITLIISTLVLFYFHEEWNRYWYWFMSVAFIAGFSIEALGVATGSVFGTYHYSSVLGPQLLDTPLIIGVNWLILIYASGTIMNKVPGAKIVKVVGGALLMVLLDFAIEPVAVKLNFWTWKGSEIPVINYISWFIISFMLLWVFYSLSFKKNNRIAFFFYMVQIVFFVLLSFML